MRNQGNAEERRAEKLAFESAGFSSFAQGGGLKEGLFAQTFGVLHTLNVKGS